MQTGQNNTGSRGQKDVFLTSGSSRFVGPIGVAVGNRPGMKALAKVYLGSSSVLLDGDDVDNLMAILKDARRSL
jgi:hypothetical protein